MERYILLAVMAMVLGGCAQLPERADHSKPGNIKQDVNILDRDTKAPTNQADDYRPVGRMIELRMIDDEMRAKLGLITNDMLITATNDATHKILYISKDLDDEFEAAPDEFIHHPKLANFIRTFALNDYMFCKQRAWEGGVIWIPRPPCPQR